MSDITRTLLLTGASQGIGHATVKRFSAAGWRVLTVARRPFPAECPWPDGPRDHLQLDVGDIAALEGAIEAIRARLDGRLHALVNNAGVSPKNPQNGRLGLLETDYATWLAVFKVNLFSAALLARGLIGKIAAARGSIVNVTSIAGSRVHPFAGAAYAASKAALAALTREMAHDFGPLGVRCNAIAPGEIDTPILSPGTAEVVRERIPMRRLGRPEEVAETIYFLCSDAGSYLNGAEIHINGGEHV